MKRNDKTTLSKLSKGDRFHFPKKKKVFEYIKTEPVGVLGAKKYIYKSDNDLHETESKKDKSVIFLRKTI